MALAPRASIGLTCTLFRALFNVLFTATCVTCGSAWAQSSTPRADVEVLGGSSHGSMGRPRLVYDGSPIIGNPFALRLRDARANSFAVIGLSVSASALPLPDFGAVSHLALPPLHLGGVPIDAHGVSSPHLALPEIPASLSGVEVFAQAVVIDPLALGGWAFTSGLRITVGVGPAAPWRQFRAPHGHFAARDNVALAAGDIDGDGDVDLVMASGSTQGVDVALNNGDRSFTLVAPFDLTNHPYDVELADFDGDGLLDLAVVNFVGNNVSIGRGVGDGSFTEHFIAPLDLLPTTMSVEDFDGDGHLDIAVNNRGASTLSLLLGNGDATFAPKVTLLSGVEPLALAAADIDADGRLDIVTANSIGSMSVLLQQSVGVYSNSTFDSLLLAPSEVALLDFDGDGHLDVVVGSRVSGALRVHSGDGTGTFVHEPTADASGDPVSIALHDMDGDGERDLVIGSYTTDSVFVTPAESGGWFAGISTSRTYEIPLSSSPSDLEIADLDGDGLEDLAGVGRFGLVALTTAWRDASGAFELPVLYDDIVRSDSFTIGDFNIDGLPDVAYYVTNSNFGRVALGDGVGGFVTGADHTAVYTTPARTGDVTGDGIPDVVTSPSIGVILRVEPGLGTALGDFAPTLGQSLMWSHRAVELGDVNGDGRLDVVARLESSTRLHVLLGNGDGTFEEMPTSMVFPHNATTHRLGDLDGDGDLDIVTISQLAGQLSIALGNGDGTFAAPLTFALEPSPRDVEFGDFDGDGVGDVVVVHGSSGDLTVVRGSATGAFAPTHLALASGQIENIAVGDVDGDGHLDVVAAQVQTQAVLVLNGNGDGTFVVGERFASFGVGRVELVDADGDGDLDVVTAHPHTSRLSLVTNLLVD